MTNAAMSYSHLATHLRSIRRDASVAESLYARALNILQSTMVPNSAQVASVLNNQGMLFALTHREKEAEVHALPPPSLACPQRRHPHRRHHQQHHHHTTLTSDDDDDNGG